MSSEHATSTRIHEDRVGLDRWLLISLASGAAVLGAMTAEAALWVFGLGFASRLVLGALVGAGLVVGLRSVSVRAVTRTVVALSALTQMRLGVLGDSLVSGSQTILLWVLTSVVMLVLADVVETSSTTPMRGWRVPSIRRTAAARAGATALATLVLVVVAAPLLAPFVSSPAQSGKGPQLEADDGGGQSLRATDTLDMTTRPDLHDDVVFTVTSKRGTFWRGQIYDAWDGRSWTRTDTGRYPLAPDGEVVPAGDDLGAFGDELFTQRFRMEATYSDVVFAAASPVSIDTRHAVVQNSDGTMQTAGVALGRDSTYTVRSRRPVLSETKLRSSSSDAPPTVVERYAAVPVATDRVVQAAREATAGATNDYDRIRALERWMGERTEYSLDAPLSPVGVDVVDHFLFESRQGWCEQVASSLVVMARANGIPARLVTGFVPGEVDRLTGAYVVRGRDAHAWAEVWFADVGWVSFDPTAEVPLAGADSSDRFLGQWVADHLVLIVVGALVSAVVVHGSVTLAKWLRARRAARPSGWVAVTDARLGEVGKRAEWPRSESETASRFAGSLAIHLREPRLAEVGAAIDDSLYAPLGPDAARRAEVDKILDQILDGADA